EPPPALEAPEALLGDPQARDAGSGPPELARFEVEKALEGRGLPGAVGLTLTAIEEDHDRRALADVVCRAHRPATSGASRCWTPFRSHIARRSAPWITSGWGAAGLGR